MNKEQKEVKTFFGMVTFIAIVATGIMALGMARSPIEEKKYKVELDINSWQVILDVIDKSSAPHTTVQAASKAIVEQIKAPFEAEQKRITDSLDKTKVKPKN